MEDDATGGQDARADSLLPYDAWTEEALRLVAVRALDHVAKEGVPGEHHFYVSFRTDLPGVSVPQRLLAQYPREMTIVLQHQFWDLVVDHVEKRFSVGLSFGGIPTTLSVPFGALTAFADPHVQFGLRFTPEEALAPEPEPAPAPVPAEAADPAPEPGDADTAPQVVSLAAFRKRTTKE